jgi:hypothetical protein
MKLLSDQNLSFKICTLLSDRFPDSKPVRHLGLDQSDDRIVGSPAMSADVYCYAREQLDSPKSRAGLRKLPNRLRLLPPSPPNACRADCIAVKSSAVGHYVHYPVMCTKFVEFAECPKYTGRALHDTDILCT